MSNFGSMVLTGSVLAVIGLFAVKLFLFVMTGFMALLSFLLFKLLPIALIGWLVLKAIKYMRSGSEKPAME